MIPIKRIDRGYTLTFGITYPHMPKGGGVMPMMCRLRRGANGHGVEIGCRISREDITDVTAIGGGGGWTALIGEHVVCKRLEWVVGISIAS